MQTKTAASLSVWLCLTTGAPLLTAQQGSEARVAVIRDGDRDLERTAFRLRIPVGQLQQARRALLEATQILQEIDVDQIQAGRALPHLWLRLDRRQAVQSLEALLNKRSAEVSRSESGAEYEKLLRWAVELASEIAELDPSRARRLLETWPPPQEWLGDSAAELFDKLHDELASDDFSQRFSRDARQALANLFRSKHSSSRYRDDLSRIRRTQDREEANHLVDGIVSQLGQVKDPRQVQIWTSLARLAASLPHDRYSELLRAALLASTRIDSASASQQSTIYQVDGKEVALDLREYRILQTLQGFVAAQPEALLNVLEDWPDAKEVVSRLGGLDRSLRARAVAVHRAGEEPRDYRDSRRAREESAELFQQLKANAFSRPWWVRQRLKAMGSDAEQGFEQLPPAAQRCE